MRRRHVIRRGHAKAGKLSVTMPDGTVVTRTTNRPYTHVVAGYFEPSPDYGEYTWSKSDPHPRWAPATWTTNPAQAMAKLQKDLGKRGFVYGMSNSPLTNHKRATKLVIVPVDRKGAP
jgi:hypothetical protein